MEDLMQMNLRGIILSRYKSIAEFSREIGWDQKKTGQIVNGTRQPTADDMVVIAKAAGFANDCNLFVHFFFPTLSTKWTN